MPDGQKHSPAWVRWLIAAGLGAGSVVGGQKALTDSPVHLFTEGQMPVDPGEWKCAPEGGLIGAPIVCHPPDSVDNSTGTSTAP